MTPLRESALLALGRSLRAAGYDFVTVTPATHARNLARDRRLASTLRDVFGWSRAFRCEAVPPAIFRHLEAAGALVESQGLYRSAVRFSTCGGELFVHSGYPTVAREAVFFGPDTHRFCAAVARARVNAKRVVDVGCGTGAGGIVAGRTAERVVLADVNDEALAFARVNVALAGREAEIVRSDVLAGVGGDLDLVIANPPYMLDSRGRAYRDGGGSLGEGLSVRIVREALDRLAPQGTLLLYTGTTVVDGIDVFRRAVEPFLVERGVTYTYEEVDPDVFGEELEEEGYAAVERIAAVLLTVTSPRA